MFPKLSTLMIPNSTCTSTRKLPLFCPTHWYTSSPTPTNKKKTFKKADVDQDYNLYSHYKSDNVRAISRLPLAKMQE